MVHLRPRKVEEEKKEIKIVTKKTIKKKKIVTQTFTGVDNDISTIKYFPKTLDDRNQFINPKTGRKVTPYQFKVYDYVSRIPVGYVTSYKVLSQALNSHPRAVGQALRVNPFAPLPVPCHRVIASDYSIGGFDGAFGNHQFTADKKAKLEAEGCTFEKHYQYKHNKDGSNTFFNQFSLY